MAMIVGGRIARGGEMREVTFRFVVAQGKSAAELARQSINQSRRHGVAARQGNAFFAGNLTQQVGAVGDDAVDADVDLR